MCRRALQFPFLAALAFAGWAICSKIAESAIGLPLDDAYIFKRYALNLAAGAGFSFNPGEPSFGCSSFLWTVLLELLVKVLGKDHYLAIAQSAGIFFTAAAIYLLLRLLRDYTESWLLVLTAALLAWFSGATFMNAVSGMENGLFCFLTLAAIRSFNKHAAARVEHNFRTGIWAGMAFLTRPEGLYFAIAIGMLLLYKPLRENRFKFFQAVLFALGFFALAAPYLWWVHNSFHQFMPYTYLAKIYSSDPEILTRSLGRKLTDGFSFLLGGWHDLFHPWLAIGWVLAFFAVLGIGYGIIELLRERGNVTVSLIAGWMFLPLVYGFSFPVKPNFGGYYQRYISSVWLIMILLGLITLHKVYMSAMPKILRSGCVRKPIYLIGFIVVLIYCIPIAKGQLRDGRAVYKQEVDLNQTLRLSAADWLGKNTPQEARVLAGYTGLGVVGGESGRYVLDVGAIINPDILPYLDQTAHLSEARWKNILKYVCDKKLDYFVSFAPIFGPDPARTRGFVEAARLGVPGQPQTPYEQVRIYKIDRAVLCPASTP